MGRRRYNVMNKSNSKANKVEGALQRRNDLREKRLLEERMQKFYEKALKQENERERHTPAE